MEVNMTPGAVKQIAILTLLLLSQIAFTQQDPVFYKKIDKSAERPIDPLSDLYSMGKNNSSLKRSILNHSQLDSTKRWKLGSSWYFDGAAFYSYTDSSEVEDVFDYFGNPTYHNTYYFDGNDNLKKANSEFWNGQWSLRAQYLYYYNSENQVIESIYKAWSGNMIENSSRLLYIYDSKGYLITLLDQLWVNSAWTTYANWTYLNDTEGRPVEVIIQKWQNQWVNYKRIEFLYDSSFNLIEEITQLFGDNTWINYDRYVYSYDHFANELSRTEQWYGNEWLNIERYEYTYDDESNKISFLLQNWDEAWKDLDSTHYYYSTISGSPDQFQNAGLMIYPNPATTHLEYNLLQELESADNYAIFSLDAVRRQIGQLNTGNSIEISNLASGMYLLLIETTEKKQYMQKFVKQ